MQPRGTKKKEITINLSDEELEKLKSYDLMSYQGVNAYLGKLMHHLIDGKIPKEIMQASSYSAGVLLNGIKNARLQASGAEDLPIVYMQRTATLKMSIEEARALVFAGRPGVQIKMLTDMASRVDVDPVEAETKELQPETEKVVGDFFS